MVIESGLVHEGGDRLMSQSMSILMNESIN